VDANFDRRFIEQSAVQSPPRRCWRNEFTARFQTSRPVSKRSPRFSLDDDRIGFFTTWLKKKKKKELDNHLKRTDYPFACKYLRGWVERNSVFHMYSQWSNRRARV